jgi:large subunit ribosomal protein L18
MRTSRTTAARNARRERVRRRVRGTEERPRLSVFRSGKHIYAQVIADVGSGGKTVLAVSTLSPEIRGELKKTANVEAAKQVGLLVARRCKEKGIDRIVFDRNGFIYHGRVRAVAEGAREGGLQF